MKFYQNKITLEEINLELKNIYLKMDEIKNNKNMGFSDSLWFLEESNLRIQELVKLKKCMEV